MNYSEQDVDNLLASVEQTLAKADVLAKSSLKKDDKGEDEGAAAAPAQDAPPADAAPAADAGAAPAADAAAPAAADAGAAPAPEAAAAGADAGAAPGAEGDAALQAEGAQDAPLSDEELSQIYSSMPPEEQERHYSVLRQALQASYAQDQGQADAAAAPAAPGADAAAAPAAAAPAPEEMMGKSEKDAEIQSLRKQVGEQAQAIEQITKAFEVLTKPSRKAITDIQVIQKSEFDAPPAQGEGVPMTKEQAKEALRKIPGTKLEKSERDMVNKFFITGEGQKEIEKLIHSKGGK